MFFASFLQCGCAGVIEVLVNSGRQIDAVNLAFAFDLTEQFSPVPLLKSYLKDARKASSPVRSANSSPTLQVCGLVSAILKPLLLVFLFVRDAFKLWY